MQSENLWLFWRSFHSLKRNLKDFPCEKEGVWLELNGLRLSLEPRGAGEVAGALVLPSNLSFCSGLAICSPDKRSRCWGFGLGCSLTRPRRLQDACKSCNKSRNQHGLVNLQAHQMEQLPQTSS